MECMGETGDSDNPDKGLLTCNYESTTSGHGIKHRTTQDLYLDG